MSTPQAAVLTELGSRGRAYPVEVQTQANTPLNITKARTPTDATPPASPSPIPASSQRDAAILAAIRAGATHQRDARTHRRHLQHQARAFMDFNHFRRLCLHDLHLAYTEDRSHHTRMTKYRRLAWLALFRHFAAHTGLRQDIRITATDRHGHYTCYLIDQAPPNDWEKFIRLGEHFGIREDQLNALCPTPQGGTHKVT